MLTIAEKPGYVNARAVKVWTKAGPGRFFESEKPYFYAISWKNDGE